jgi:hypothetical protein
MPITIRNLPAIPAVDPSSLADERNATLEAATEQLRSDFPGIRFGERPQPPATGAPAAAIEPPAPEQPPLRFTYGRKQPAAPAPVKEAAPADKVGWLSGMGRGIAERTARIVGFVPDTANTIADVLPDWLDKGLKIDSDGIRVVEGQEYRDVSLGKKASKALDAVDFGSNRAPLATTEEIKEQWKAGDKWDAAGNAAQFAVEQGILSLPDMVAVIANMPLYTIGMAGDYAQTRAQNDGRDQANAADALISAGTAVFVSALERYGADKVFDRLGGKETKTKLRKWVEGIIAEAATEAAQNPAEFAGTYLGTAKEGEVTAGALAEQAGFGALGGAGGGATIGGAVQLLSDNGQAPPPPLRAVPPGGTTVSGTAQPAPVAPPTGGQAAAVPTQPAAAAASRLPKPGDALLYKPSPTMDGAVVEVRQIDPATQTTLVVRVDPESGEAMLDDEGQPLTFVATFDELGLNAPPPPAPAVVNTTAPPAPEPLKPSQVPPATTSVEPTSDVKGQLKDMWRNDTPRRGVYLSPETVAKMRAEGTYAAATKSGVVEADFDGQGGTLIVKSRKDLEEAQEARDGGQTDMQAIVGMLTGAGVKKPDVPKPVTVQRKDAAGAVVQQTAVAPADVQATVAAVSQLPGTTEVVSPEAAIAERAQKVEAEQGTTPTLEPVTATQSAPPAEPKPKARGPLAQMEDALAFATTAMTTTKGPTSVKIDVRTAANAVGSLAQALRAAIVEAQRRGATDEDVEMAAEAAGKAERLTEKDDGDFAHSRGVSETILRKRMAELSDAVASLEKFQDAPLQPAKETKADKAKAVSKKKEAKAAPVEVPLTREARMGTRASRQESMAKSPGTEVTLKDGVKVTLRTMSDEVEGQIAAYDADGNVVGTLDYTKVLTPDGKKFNPASHVNETWRRKGLATAMYDMAEQAGGLIATNEENDKFGGIRSDDAKAFHAAREAAKESAATGRPVAPKPQVTNVGQNLIDTIKFFAGEAGQTADAVRGALSDKGKRAAFISRLPSDMRMGFKALAEDFDDAADVSKAEVLGEGKSVRVARGKTKYVPPKKREPTVTEVAEAAGEKVAVPQAETIALAPSSVVGQEAEFVSELLGAGTQELVQEAQMDATGQLAGTLQQIMTALNNRGNWTGWFAAVTRGGIMTRDQRNQMFRHIREYASADQTELNAAREALLGDATNVDGKTLPPEAISAVFEAANVARAYNVIREQLAYEASDARDDLNEIEADTQTSGFDTRDMTGEGASLFARRVKGKVLESPERTLESLLKLPKGKLRESMLQLNKLMTRDRWIHGVIARAMADQQNRGAYGVSTHELFDNIISRAREMGPEQYPFVRVLTLIRKSVPNVPIEFIERGQPILDLYGRQMSKAAGRWFPDGLMQVSINMTDDGAPLFSVFDLHTIIHEAVHGATMYEVSRNPDGPVATELRNLRLELVRKAAKKYGAREIADAVKYFRSKDKTGPKPLLVEKLGNMLYGLTDELELLSETFSNPDFHGFINSLDQTPVKSWYRARLNSLLRAIGRLFGKTPQDSRILNDLMVVGMRTMDAQAARRERIARSYPKAAEQVSKILNLPLEKAAALVHSTYTFADAPIDVYRLPKTSVPAPRGTPETGYGRQWDRTSQTAYTAGPQTLFRGIADQRMSAARSASPQQRAPESPERLKNHEKLTALTGPRTTRALAGVRRLMRSQFVAGARDVAQGVVTTDFLVRRNARLFGSSTDTTNPLVEWKQLRDTRRSFANQLMELAEKTVNATWMKLTATQSQEIGSVLQDTTLWQIDPEGGAQQPRLIKSISKKRWDAKRLELEERWAKLTDEQKNLYRSVQKYFKTEYSKIRRASMDLAIDLYGVSLTPQQRTLLYALKNPDGAANIIGAGKPIDLGEMNDKFTKVVKDLVRVSSIKGPYFPLFRKGDYVVEAAREGVLSEEGVGIEFSQKDDALAAADEIRALAPKNTAKVKAVGDKYIVQYKMRHVSFHMSENEAVEEVAALAKQGFAVEGDTFSRKLESIESSSMSEGLRELMTKAEAVAGAGGQSEEQAAIVQTLRAAFTQILAERAASASTQLKRQGVGGFKGKEAHEIFSRRVRASSWHYANLKTSVAQSKALSRLRKFSRSWEEGGVAPGMDAQQTVLARGRVMGEITRRLRVESEELDSLDKSSFQYYLGQLGFVNFLASPSYAFVNSMQNFNVALPYMAGQYGMRGTRAMIRGMRVVAGPAFARAMRGLAQRPGDVTSYDVYTAIADAVKQDPKFARFTQGNGTEPSALQQLVDRGVINASYVQELTSIANNQHLGLTRGLEYLRLLPQGAELWNRISTALAVLEVTNGNVDKAADAVDQVHFQYALENRPRYFRKVGGTRIPQALTMFKMYSVAMYQLTGSLIVDAVGKRGQSRAERRAAATSLAGIIASHTLSAGIVGGIMIEPLRFLRELWNQLFGDDDEFKDLDTMVQLWATEVTGSEDAGRLLSKGLWNSLGFDLSDRMGLDKVMFYNPPEGADEDSFWKFLGQTVGGPIPAMIIQKGTRVYDKAVMQGKPFDAIMEAIPVKLFQDAKKAWEIVHRGVTTKAGETVVPAETFGYLDAVGRMAGFRTTEEVKASDQASTEFRYKNWRTVRARQLSNAFWQSYESGDEAAQAQALAAIRRFNEKNPGAQVTADSLKQSKQQRAAAAKTRVGEGRNPDLNRLLAY